MKNAPIKAPAMLSELKHISSLNQQQRNDLVRSAREIVQSKRQSELNLFELNTLCAAAECLLINSDPANHLEGFEMLLITERHQYPYGSLILGSYYWTGRGIPEADISIKDRKAFEYYTKAVHGDSKNSAALKNLAHCYWTGRGIPYAEISIKDQKAFEYFTKAVRVDPNDSVALNSLGNCYWTGRGIPDEDISTKDQKAFEYYTKAVHANSNNSGALKNLANCYWTGRGIPYAEISIKDQKAFEYLTKAVRVDPNDSAALNSLGNCYGAGRGIPDEDISTKDQKAFEYYTKAVHADSKNTAALNNLANCYWIGRGIPDAEMSIRDQKAFEYFTKAVHVDPNNSVARDHLKRMRQQFAPNKNAVVAPRLPTFTSSGSSTSTFAGPVITPVAITKRKMPDNMEMNLENQPDKKAKSQNDELIAMLKSQLSDKQAIINLQNEKIATLEKQLKELISRNEPSGPPSVPQAFFKPGQ